MFHRLEFTRQPRRVGVLGRSLLDGTLEVVSGRVESRFGSESLPLGFSAGDVVVVGNRPDAQRIAIEVGVALLVTSNGSEPTPEVLDLARERRVYLRNRWLDQVAWLSGKADQAKRWHYAVRWFALAGGLVIPVLAGLSLEGSTGDAAQYAIVVLGLLVAVALGHEDLFKNGERWQHYRQSAEMLKIQGWR